MKKSPRPPSELTELPIPPEFERIVLRCLEKRPEDRFQTAEELEAALLEVPVDKPWSRDKAREWWHLHAEAIRPVLYESSPEGAVAPST